MGVSPPTDCLAIATWGEPPRLVRGSSIAVLSDQASAVSVLHQRPVVVWDPFERVTRARPARFGARPLYFAPRADGILLGPSLVGLRQCAGRDARLDPMGVAEQLCGEAGASPQTVFRGVFRIPSGLELRVGPLPQTWSLTAAAHDDEVEPAPASSLERALRATLLANAETGKTVVPLSGGLDSSLLLALALESGIAVRTASLDDGEEPVELERACELAAHWGLSHEVVRATDQEVVAAFPEAAVACGSLLWNARATAKLLFWRRLRSGAATRVLSGVGADEVFWGYPSGWEPRGTQPTAMARRLAGDRDWVRRLGLAGSEPPLPAPWPVGDRSVTRQFFLRHTLPHSTLPPETHASSWLGLDVRLPYLDIEVLRCALGHDWGSLARGDLGKLPLRALARARLPSVITDAAKSPVLSRADGPRSARRRGWAAAYERWIGRPGFVQALEWNRVELDSWLRRFRSAQASDPELPRVDRLLMRLASLSALHAAAGCN